MNSTVAWQNGRVCSFWVECILSHLNSGWNVHFHFDLWCERTSSPFESVFCVFCCFLGVPLISFPLCVFFMFDSPCWA